MNNNILEVKNLKKIFHDQNKELTAIENINFNIKKNEFISIVGPSGCGKSTILSILAGLQNKSEGKINKKNNLRLGYMLQQDSLFPWKTVYQNALIGLEIKHEINKKTKENISNLLKKYGLDEFKDNYPNSLSGGMRQRVALIRTLAINPDILLLDEPFSALDYQTRLTLSDDLIKIIKNEEKTAIMVTHDIAEAISMSDKVIVLSKRPGKIKKIYNINLDNKKTPTEKRKDNKFMEYYDAIWKELDEHV